jgi:predicted O-methyltransferase YrrM
VHEPPRVRKTGLPGNTPRRRQVFRRRLGFPVAAFLEIRGKLSRYASWLYDARRNGADALALARLAPLSCAPLPWTEFSMRPVAIEAAVSEVLLNARRSIVECGSGNSTVYLARLLSQLGVGHVFSLEHDLRWAALTSSLVEREGLTQWATVVHAPLVNGWYDRNVIPIVEDIDLLVIDGPPANTEELAHARYPALPHFSASLARGSAVLMDDVDRPGEREVLERWAREFGIAVQRPHDSFAIIRT